MRKLGTTADNTKPHRWKKGQSGNPKGLRPGTLHAKTIFKAALAESELDVETVRQLAVVAMLTGIKRGIPFFWKAAVWNFNLRLADPDFLAKKALLELEGVTTQQVDDLVSGILSDLQAAASTPAARAAFAKCEVLQDVLAGIRERRAALFHPEKKLLPCRVEADVEEIKNGN